jgi:hypothetical protein
MNPFRASRYVEHVRDAHAGADAPIPRDIAASLDCPRLLIAGPGASLMLRQIAWLTACGVLDARFDCLQLPVFASSSDIEKGGLAEMLEAQWPEIDWRERLGAGACLVLIADASPGAIAREVAAWPACRFIVACDVGEPPQLPRFRTVFTDPLLQSSFTCP